MKTEMWVKTICRLSCVLLFVLSSCAINSTQLNQNYSTPPTSTGVVSKLFTETPSSTPEIIPTGTPTLTPAHTQTPTMTSKSEERIFSTVKRHCFQEINPLFPENDTSVREGGIVFYERASKKVFRRGVEDDEKQELPGAIWGRTFGSPDKKKLGYVNYQNDQIVLISTEGDEGTVLGKTTEFKEKAAFSGWINNTILAFRVGGHQPIPLITLDYLTKAIQEIKPEYPDINSLDPWDWYPWGRTIYNADMRYVVYPVVRHNVGHIYVLWDIRQGKEISTIEAGHASYKPKWAPNGRWFAVGLNDFYMMNLDGKQTRITNLEGLYPEYMKNLRAWNWSPDSQKIAFWLDLCPAGDIHCGDLIEERLMVLDISSRELTDYCTLGDQIKIDTGNANYSPAPIWSPDGSELLIENRNGVDESSLVIIDLKQNRASVIGKNLYPIEWMQSK